MAGYCSHGDSRLRRQIPRPSVTFSRMRLFLCHVKHAAHRASVILQLAFCCLFCFFDAFTKHRVRLVKTWLAVSPHTMRSMSKRCNFLSWWCFPGSSGLLLLGSDCAVRSIHRISSCTWHIGMIFLCRSLDQFSYPDIGSPANAKAGINAWLFWGYELIWRYITDNCGNLMSE